jgi:hypothetical protein
MKHSGLKNLVISPVPQFRTPFLLTYARNNPLFDDIYRVSASIYSVFTSKNSLSASNYSNPEAPKTAQNSVKRPISIGTGASAVIRCKGIIPYNE